VEVPPNTTATVQLPDTLLKDVTESGKSVENRDDISGAKQLEKAVALEIGAGMYEFETLLQKIPSSSPPQANQAKPD
jgi:alpha-L-rhamnosidase